jgi:energy-coupling factor transporter ATP-binding protein EcfA2
VHPFLRGARPAIAKQITSTALLGAGAYEDLQAEPVDYLWEDFLEASHLALIAGPSGVGKSTLLFLLAAALANTTPRRPLLLGRAVNPIPEGKCVVLLEEENGRRSTAANLVWSCEMLGLPVAPTLDRIVTLVRSGVRIRHQTDRGDSAFTSLWERAEAGRIGALLIDSWATVCTANDVDSRSEEHQALVAKTLRGFVEVSGGPCVAIAHTRKSGAESLEDIAGSHQRGAAMDLVLLVSAEKSEGIVQSSRVTVAKMRDTPDEPPLAAVFTIVREGGRHRLVEGKADPSGDPPHERVHAWLEAQDAPATSWEIRGALKMNNQTLQDAITTLFSERRIRKAKKLVKGVERNAFESLLSLDNELEIMGFDPGGRGPK